MLIEENQQIITSAAITTNVFSTEVKVPRVLGFAIQAHWAGSVPIGTLKLQGSCDDVGVSATTWTDIGGSSQPVSGASGSHMYNCFMQMYPRYRVVYTHTSGDGYLNARAHMKWENRNELY